MVTEERAKTLAEYLSADPERAKRLLAMEVPEALKAINADGFDFTADEIESFGDALRLTAQEGELGAEDLDHVSGGVVTLAGLVGAGFLVKVCFDVGRTIGKNAPW